MNEGSNFAEHGRLSNLAGYRGFPYHLQEMKFDRILYQPPTYLPVQSLQLLIIVDKRLFENIEKLTTYYKIFHYAVNGTEIDVIL